MFKLSTKLALAIVLAAFAFIAPASPAPASAAQPRIAVVRGPEVKLRKLHLVRPDLIPYPIFFEVYC